MHSIVQALALSATLLSMTSAVFSAPPAEEVSSKIAAYMDAAAKVDEFSGAVIVVNGDGTLFECGVGLANREHDIPNTPDTKFRIGSVTKPFTAMAIMILQERGKLSVNDPITRHLGTAAPESGAWSDITIHHLLTHTSGIPNYTDIPGMMQKTARLPASIDEVIDSFRDKPLDFAAGEKFAYSNSGYILLGRIIEEASGSDYETFMREAIFEPLGMRDTGYDRHGTILPGRAAGYQGRGERVANAPYLDMAWPYAAGALYSTVRDMARWNRALIDGALISPESYAAMYTPFKDGYAYGWSIGRLDDRRVHDHSGGIHGFTSYFLRFPDDGVCVVALSNVLPSEVTRTARDLARIALGEEVALPMALIATAIDPAAFDALAGQYQFGPERIVSFRRDGDRFFTQLTGQEEFEIFPTSETEFFLKVVEARVTFVKGDDGRASHVILHQRGRSRTAERIEGDER